MAPQKSMGVFIDFSTSWISLLVYLKPAKKWTYLFFEKSKKRLELDLQKIGPKFVRIYIFFSLVNVKRFSVKEKNTLSKVA